ncbi:MAG: hypothetical protein JRN06_09745 [Nitrososphaerota archaeon]|nr:hypothetical protein [Nitrososphaerota archaeon]MDG7024868.1 hypothetical protein [Nitrososphaerota archaeon]
MYAKSLVVFTLCTALVIGVAVVLNYEAASVGNQIRSLPTLQATCSPNDSSCPHFSIVSTSLRTQNTTDQLGIANPAFLTLELNVSGNAALSSVHLYVGNVSAGVVQGPFGPGMNRIVNFTLSAAAVVSPGRTYLLSVQGFNASGGYVIESEEVTDVGQVPYYS